MSNADKLQSIYFCERIIAEANNDIDRLQADKRLIEEKIKVRVEERDEAALTLSAVKEAIHSVKNPIHRELLERYYLKGQTWEQAAAKMHYSTTHIYRLRKEAIDEINLDFLHDTGQYVCYNRSDNY